MKNFSMLDEKEKKKRTWIKRIFILVGIILIVVLANIPFIANPADEDICKTYEDFYDKVYEG